ncbi:MAG: DNA polymerase III subunit delta [Thermoleophilia bacterium]
MSEKPALKPAYLISGSDRPKVEQAVHRLRARFVAESVEMVSALEVTGPDVVNLCNSGSLFGDARLVVVVDIDGRKKEESRAPTGGWKTADVQAVVTYLSAPAPDTVLALVGLEIKKDAAIAKACARIDKLLFYDVAKHGRVAWVAERFRLEGVKAESDACALLVQYIGETDLHALANEITKIATWAQGEPIGVAEVEQLVAPVAGIAPFALTDAWAERRQGRLLDLCETIFERSDKPRRDTAPRLAATLNGHVSRMRQLKRLADDGVTAKDAALALGMHPFAGEKAYRHAEGFSGTELASATVRFAELDLALKGGSRLAADVELQRALIAVSAEPGQS